MRAGVKRIDITGRKLQLYFSEAHQKNPLGLVDMVVAEPDRFEFTPDHTLKVKLQGYGSGGLVAKTKNILKEIALHVNS